MGLKSGDLGYGDSRRVLQGVSLERPEVRKVDFLTRGPIH